MPNNRGGFESPTGRLEFNCRQPVAGWIQTGGGMCISRARILQLIFQNVMCLIGEYPYFVVYYLMETFFQRIGTLATIAWGLGIIYLLFYILKYLNGIASFLVHMAGM